MRRRHAADVVGARLYEKSNVIELQLADLAHQDSRRDAKKKTKTTSSALALAEPRKPFPGHFVFLKCPQISLVEWHPFSLAAVRVLMCSSDDSLVRSTLLSLLTLLLLISLFRPPVDGATTPSRFRYESLGTGRVSAPREHSARVRMSCCNCDSH